MSKQIISRYDGKLGAIIVRMPEKVSLSMLEYWQEEFRDLVTQQAVDKNVALLLDTNKHLFESIECLKLIRNLLSNDPQLKKYISRVAFVSPRQYKEPEVISHKEGYFDKFDDAYYWLQR